MKRLIILGKGAVGNKPMALIRTKEDIPGYDGEDVWTVATHTIENADGYLALHGEKNHLDRQIEVFGTHLKQACIYDILINNSITAMLMKAAYKYDSIRIAGCPMSSESEYDEQRESLFMTIGFLRGKTDTKITWDNDIQSYSNYYSNVLGLNY